MTARMICVLGLGYIGLPTASMFATHGVRVIGVDTNPQVLKTLNTGKIHIEEAGLLEVVRAAMESGNLQVRSGPVPADAFIIAVPTPINSDKSADMRAVRSAAESIVPHLRKGNLVILESTSPPGTTRDLLRSILQRTGMKAGEDFHLAYSPERVLPGQILKELVGNARVVGGIDRPSAEACRALYSTFVEGEIVLTDATTAEMVKLMENTFRDVNIALANEFALIAERLGVNVWEAISAANRHPRVRLLRPGPGVGGHCIAVDPWFLVEAAPEQARLIRQARQVNDGMPHHVVDLVRGMLQGIPNPAVACLGLTYKADVDDVRESPAMEIVRGLVDAGVSVRAFDPHVAQPPIHGARTCSSLEQAVDNADAAVILVDHAEFRSMRPQSLCGIRRRILLDTRDCMDAAAWTSAGFQIMGLGRQHSSQF